MANEFGRAKTYEVYGLDDRLKIIAKQVDESTKDPWTYTFASELVSGTRLDARPTQNDGSEWQEINAVYWWFANNVRYNPDTVNYDVFRTLKQTVAHRQGDCDCLTVSIASVMATLGYRVGAKAISKDGSNWHIYPIVALPRDSSNYQGYVAMDVTQPGSSPGWEPGAEYRRYTYYITWEPDGKYSKEAA